jgi:hypothetical protein
MATDVDVQFFSHLNGLVLSNNWGDLIRLLDTCLVNGLPLTAITSATIDAQGDITLNLYAEHKALLFQVIELQGFVPASINGKYRIKGTPDSKTLILKAELKGQAITTTGTAKLASLGYEIIFRDPNDVKRVYRTKNPTVEHPFIRVDESLTSPDDTSGVYTSSYAKYAMVGLLENMTHIDDYENPEVLQLPFDSTDPAKNWKITGTGTNVIRGWNRWYWRKRGERNPGEQYADSDSINTNGSGQFTLIGDQNAFYFLTNIHVNFPNRKIMMGCGLFDSIFDKSLIQNWFLGGVITQQTATSFYNTIYNSPNMTMVCGRSASGHILVLKHDPANPLTDHTYANCDITGYRSGINDLHSNSLVAATSFPFGDDNGFLRGNLKHVCFSRKNPLYQQVTPIIAESSMYIYENLYNNPAAGDVMGGFYFYMGELE